MKALSAALAAAALLLAACGGGDDPPPTAAEPTIIGFSAETPVPMGERAQLRPLFAGGSGRIEPGLGPVASGVAVATPPLEGDAVYRLVVEAPGKPAAVRTLAVSVQHRDRFVPASALASAYHAALELPDGGVLVIGGSRGDSVLSRALDRFDPATRSFRRIGEMATGRAQARAVLLADGHVLVVGGQTSAASGVAFELVDPATGRVTPAGVPVVNRTGHTATRLADGRVLIAGGLEESTAELWDPVTRSSRLLGARMSHGREWHTATLLADGRVLLVGGYSLASAYWLAEVFDPATERFTPIGAPRLAPFNESLALHAAHRMSDGSVLVVGGEHFIPDVDQATRPTSAVWRFDPATDRFAPQPGLLVPRALPASAVFADDRVVLIGGLDANGWMDSGELYRGARGGGATAGMGGARAHFTVSRLAGGRLLVVGGEAPNGDLIPAALIYE